MRAAAYLTGFVRLRVTGATPERLINLCLAAGIPLWNVRWRRGSVYCSLPLRHVFEVRRLAHRARCRLRVVGKGGLPILWRRARRRRALVALALVVLVGLYAFSSFVWFFEVRGNAELSDAQVLRAAAAAGLRPGAWRPALHPDVIARDMILHLPALSWVGVRFVGTKAIVEVAERDLPPEMRAAGPGDLVARRAGVVREVFVLQGEPAVEAGDTVAPGQVLVRGRVSAPAPVEEFPTPGEERPTELIKPVRARGRVTARAWYEGYLELPLEERVASRTGRRAQQRLLAAGRRRLVFSGLRGAPFARYEVEETSRPLLPWAGEGAPLRLITRTFHEVTERRRSRSPAEALREARRRLRQRLLEQVDVDARIVRVHVDPADADDGFVALRMRVETLEDIAVFRAREAGETPEKPP